jgi:hypothetical protein
MLIFSRHPYKINYTVIRRPNKVLYLRKKYPTVACKVSLGTKVVMEIALLLGNQVPSSIVDCVKLMLVKISQYQYHAKHIKYTYMN